MPPLKKTPPASVALPAAFVDRLTELIPADRLDAVLTSFAGAKPPSFRVNTLKADPKDVVDELGAAGLTPKPVAWCEQAWTVPLTQRDELVRSAAVVDGRVYVQGLASLLAGRVLGPRPGQAVLDLAAAPGGKTLHLAALMAGEGTIGAVEPVRDRFFRLKTNLERGLPESMSGMVRLFQVDGRLVGRKTGERFDRVLLDAPCSSEARFRCDRPDTFARWHPKKVAECARKQKALLRSALDACNVGGRVLYCTCSLSVEENERVVAHTLRRLGGVAALVPVSVPVSHVMPGLTVWRGRAMPPELARTVRVLPTGVMDAFYLALFEKRPSEGG